MEFSRYNAGWNGTSSFFFDHDRHRVSDITEPDQLDGEYVNTTLLIIAPSRAPTTDELLAYSRFLEKGNTILIFDDFGAGNDILAGIGSRITILPANLSSLDRAYPDPYSVIVYRSAEGGGFYLPESLTLNRPAPLDGGDPLMLTSVMSWVDMNGDRRLNSGEMMGTFPVMARDGKGNGQIIVFSDPSIFINSMYNLPGNDNNRLFIHSLVSDGSMVLIDQMNSRTADTNGFSRILHVIRNTNNIQIIIISILMIIVVWAWRKRTL